LLKLDETEKSTRKREGSVGLLPAGGVTVELMLSWPISLKVPLTGSEKKKKVWAMSTGSVPLATVALESFLAADRMTFPGAFLKL
jgi:hypothetical protein